MSYIDPSAPKMEVKTEGDNFKVTSTVAATPDTTSYADLMGLLKVDNPSGKEQTMLEKINAYVKDKSPVERLTTIRHLENRLGVPRIGETRLEKVYQYVKLSGQINELEGARDSLLG